MFFGSPVDKKIGIRPLVSCITADLNKHLNSKQPDLRSMWKSALICIKKSIAHPDMGMLS